MKVKQSFISKKRSFNNKMEWENKVIIIIKSYRKLFVPVKIKLKSCNMRLVYVKLTDNYESRKVFHLNHSQVNSDDIDSHLIEQKYIGKKMIKSPVLYQPNQSNETMNQLLKSPSLTKDLNRGNRRTKTFFASLTFSWGFHFSSKDSVSNFTTFQN